MVSHDAVRRTTSFALIQTGMQRLQHVMWMTLQLRLADGGPVGTVQLSAGVAFKGPMGISLLWCFFQAVPPFLLVLHRSMKIRHEVGVVAISCSLCISGSRLAADAIVTCEIRLRSLFMGCQRIPL